MAAKRSQVELFGQERYEAGLAVGKAQRDALLKAAKAAFESLDMRMCNKQFHSNEDLALREQLREAIALAEKP